MRWNSLWSSLVGVAVYVVFILANHHDNPGIITRTETNFTLDGKFPFKSTHIPTSSSDLDYNQLVFSQSGLSNEEHMVKATISGPDSLYMNFDYALYMFVPYH